MNELVFKTTALSTAEPYTTSEVIAEYSENSHHAIQQLINKNREKLEAFGKVAFEMRALPSGQKAKIYRLNEKQATFLITLLKNTPNVVAFKFELTKQFYAVSEELKRRHSLRLEDKSKRKTLTDAIKEWSLKDKYPHPYSMLTNLLCKTATGLTCKQLKERYGVDASMNKKQKQLFEMLIDLKDFGQLIKQAKNNSEKLEVVNKMLAVMFCEPNYIDKMLKIVTDESEE